MTDPEMPFYATMCYHHQFDWIFLPHFRGQIYKWRYSRTVSDKNGCQGL